MSAEPSTVTQDGRASFVTDGQAWRLGYRLADGTLVLEETAGSVPAGREVLFEADALAARLEATAIRLRQPLADELGLEPRRWQVTDAGLELPIPAFLQLQEPWLAADLQATVPEQRLEADCPEGWHPRRPPVPEGELYRKRLAGRDETFALHRARVDEHGELFHRWQNTPYVAEAWDEEGTREEHDAFLRERRRDPHTEPLIGTLDGTPFAYVEAYWAREDRIGPHCDPGPYDQGLHVLVGEPALLGGPLTAAWMRATFHFLFLRDPRTRRLVGEPDAGNDRILARVRETGWRKRGEFDFPHKRAALITLDRQRFFQEERP